MKVLKHILVGQGLTTLPVSDFGGLRSLLVCEECRDILKAMIGNVLRKKAELLAQSSGDDELAALRRRREQAEPSPVGTASEAIELEAADRPPGEVDPEVRPKDDAEM